MATLPETDEWVSVYQLETTDPVVGGPPNEATGAGMDNIPHLHLAKRTAWLKARVDALMTQAVAATTVVAGIVRLNTSTNSTSTTEAATPSAVKAVADQLGARAASTTTITGGGLATGGGDLTANRVITVPVATQAQAEAGVDNTTAMTPLRVAQRIAIVLGTTVQAFSAILTAISALAANGIIVRTGPGTVAVRSIVQGTGITITDSDGVGGNPTVGLDAAAARVLIGGGAPDAVLEDQKASGIDGGSGSQGQWITRALNTEVRDPLGIVALSASQFIVTQNCWLEASAPYCAASRSKIRVFNVTDNVPVAFGTSEEGDGLDRGSVRSFVGCALAAGKTYRIEQHFITGPSIISLGTATDIGTEVYTRVILWRL